MIVLLCERLVYGCGGDVAKGWDDGRREGLDELSSGVLSPLEPPPSPGSPFPLGRHSSLR